MSTYKEKKLKLKELVKKEQQQRRKAIEEKGHKFVDTDAFKRWEKHYKFYMHRKTDFSKLANIEQFAAQEVQGKRVYKLPYPEGAYLVKQFSNIQEQFQIGYESLNRYIYRPYRTSLDGTNGLYEKESQAKNIMSENLAVQPEEIKDENNQTLFYFNEKIRMSNLGYQYDWPKRSYPSTKVPVPETITKLTERAVQIFEEISKQKIEYHGEAVIVNFYKPRDYMTGHLDDGEIDQVNPIFSFCYGLTCVFLIGFPERDKEPLAVQLQAGDLMIMSGFSRICYHGVPRIIQNSYKIPTPEQLQFECKIPANSQGIKFINDKKQILNYFKSHRLNINIRQVYPNKQAQVMDPQFATSEQEVNDKYKTQSTSSHAKVEQNSN